MDVVYVVRPGDRNEELRYSLRSLAAHLPNAEVWIAGFHPAWVTGVNHIPTQQRSGTKWKNSTENVAAACSHPGVADRFLLFNDDMFVMAPMATVPTMHRGPVDQVATEYDALGSGRYLQGMRDTARLLAQLGHPHPLSYELHVPLRVEKAVMAHALEVGMAAGIPVLHKRTLYGNLARLGGVEVRDVKVCKGRPDWSPSWPFLSTDDTEFANGEVGAHIRDRFPEPCRYEVR